MTKNQKISNLHYLRGILTGLIYISETNIGNALEEANDILDCIIEDEENEPIRDNSINCESCGGCDNNGN